MRYLLARVLLPILRGMRWIYIRICNLFTGIYNALAKLFGAPVRFHSIEDPLPPDAFLYQWRNAMFGNRKRINALTEQIDKLQAQVQHYHDQSNRNFARYRREKMRADILDAKLKQTSNPPPHVQSDHRSALEVLGISAPYTAAELKSAHTRLVNRYHPDKHQHMSPVFQEETKQEFLRIQAAYSTLQTNPTSS